MPLRSDLWPPALAVAAWWLAAAGVSAAADVRDAAPDLLVVGNLVLAVPIAVAGVYATGRLLGGRVLGSWLVLVLVALAPAGWLYALGAYRDTYLDRVLPVALGLTDDALLASAAALAAATTLVLASVAGRTRLAAGAGAAAGVAMLLEPTAALFLAGAALAYAAARSPLPAAAFAVAAAPFVVAVLIREGVAFDASWSAFSANMANLREHLWSNRLLQWLPIAGAIGLARRSVAAASLVGGWFAAAAVALGASPNLPMEDGSYLVAFVPALPALALLAGALPLLVPGLPARLGQRVAAGRP